MDTQRQKLYFEQFLDDAEGQLKQGLDNLNEWTSHARDLWRERPGTLLGSLGAAGFMAGILFRRDSSKLESLDRDLIRNSVLAFMGGVAVGALVGPGVLERIRSRAQGVAASRSAFETH